MPRGVLIVPALILLFSGLLPARGQEFSNQAVGRAIERGIAYLLSQQRINGNWAPFGRRKSSHYYLSGPTALALYALVANDVKPQDPLMKKGLEWLKRQRNLLTYEMALRCCAFLLANRKTDDLYMRRLTRDARVLIRAGEIKNGAYRYLLEDKNPNNWDNSNSQFGVLGVWSAARGNVEIPKSYWRKVLKHWLSYQRPDGGWTYVKSGAHSEDSTATMTVSGVASLFICVDNLFAARYVKCTGGKQLPAITRGLKWLDRNFEKCLEKSLFYCLYGVERVGLASGYKYFGTKDWYKEGTAKLLGMQQPNGSWGRSVVNTSFALLFLARGRHPVLFNKLEYSGDWNNRPRALASLTRWISRNFERTVNWQIINLRVPVSEMHDATFLYISGCQKPEFSDEELDKLRTFVLQGGTIFSVTECNGAGFRKGIREVYKKLFPKHELTRIGANHPIYSPHYKLRGRPKLSIITNGVRPLVIHTDEDLAKDWQLRATATKRVSFEIIGNLARYVVGNLKDLRPRGVTHWPDSSGQFTSWKVKLARLKYAGNWDPEPLGYVRFGLLMGRRVSTEVEVETVDIKDIADTQAKVATLTGTGLLHLDTQQMDALKNWINRGGTLVIDAAGGNRLFAKSARNRLEKMFGPDALQRLPVDSPIYTLQGKEIGKVRYRRATRKRIGMMQGPQLMAIMRQETKSEEGTRPAVIFSAEDMTAGLVGYPSGVVDGYDPKNAYEIMRNVVLVTGDVKSAD